MGTNTVQIRERLFLFSHLFQFATLHTRYFHLKATIAEHIMKHPTSSSLERLTGREASLEFIPGKITEGMAHSLTVAFTE